MNTSTIMNALFCCIVILSLAKTTKSSSDNVKVKVKDDIHGVEKEPSIGTEDLKNGTRDVIRTRETSGNWIMIQRHDFTVDAAFKNKKWSHYKKGFGTLLEDSPEFWRGLDQLHALTSTGGIWTLKILVKWDKFHDGSPDPRRGTYGMAEWPYFRVASEANEFRLTIGRKTRGDDNWSDDSFNGGGVYDLNGMAFTTSDVDNDNNGGNCASTYGDRGGWWYNSCANIFLNSRSIYVMLDAGYWRRPSESTMWIKRN